MTLQLSTAAANYTNDTCFCRLHSPFLSLYKYAHRWLMSSHVDVIFQCTCSVGSVQVVVPYKHTTSARHVWTPTAAAVAEKEDSVFVSCCWKCVECALKAASIFSFGLPKEAELLGIKCVRRSLKFRKASMSVDWPTLVNLYDSYCTVDLVGYIKHSKRHGQGWIF